VSQPASQLKAKQTSQARQGKDQNNESAIDQDFTNSADALNAVAQQETRAGGWPGEQVLLSGRGWSP